MKLTSNEKKLLVNLLEDSMLNDAQLARKMRLSPQGVGKIRKRLEEKGVIEEYRLRLNYERIGIAVFAIAMLEFTPKGIATLAAGGLEKMLDSNMIDVFHTPSGIAPLIILFGFRNLGEHDYYFRRFKEENIDTFVVKQVFTFSNAGIVRRTSTELYMKVLKEMGKIIP